jgi:myo-inositol-1(or 4)-monophosphatase
MSNLPAYLRAFERFVRSTSGLRRAGSASLDLAYTACGRYDGFFEVGLFPWDMAGGALIVSEAGGIVTDVWGGPDWLKQGSVVAAGPRLHASMLAITKETL